MGHEQTSRHVRVMSVIPLKADIHQRGLDVRIVPFADVGGLLMGAVLAYHRQGLAQQRYFTSVTGSLVR